MQSRFHLLTTALLLIFYTNLTAFHSDTLIKTETGFITADNVCIGQLLSDKSRVIAKLHAHCSTITIHTQNSIITCAPHQQFLTTSDQSWHFAKDLQPGDFIESFSGIPVQIQSIEASPTKTRFCYLTVLPGHTLIISPDELIAHNHSAEITTVFLAAMPAVTASSVWAPPVAMTATAITFAWFAITKGPELAITIAHSCVYAWELLKTCGTALLDRWQRRGQEQRSCGSPEFTQELHGCGTGKLSDPLFEKDPIACSPDQRSIESIGCNYGIQDIPVTQEEIDKGVVIFQPFRQAETTQSYAKNKDSIDELPKNENKPAIVTPGSNGVYEDAPYHGKNDNGRKSKRPKNGQKALDESIEIKDKSKRRIGISEGEIVILAPTQNGKYHGHVREWNELDSDMKKVLRRNKLATKKGKLKI